MPKTLIAEPPLNPALLALKPRQVLISRPDMGKEQIIEKESKTMNLKSEEKVLLHRSIAQYLERCGFTKCFKKLLSEAKIEKKEWNTSLPDLEEIYLEFLKKKDQETVEVKDESVDVEDGKKKAENVDENGSNDRKKDKKKKTKETTETNAVEAKNKKKKKKKSKSVEAESLDDDEKDKVSKKRKRSEPEEKKEETEDDEESKRRKKEENVKEDDGSVLETPVKQTEVKENGETKSTNQKSGKRLSSSKEPKIPFQRVKVDDVVFTDDRLKDNSYWAKDGADSGYGAKAQEILGQVRGRGFRHEKTKKKRGSYRGGEIDLQSHSVKFDYSDEE